MRRVSSPHGRWATASGSASHGPANTALDVMRMDQRSCWHLITANRRVTFAVRYIRTRSSTEVPNGPVENQNGQGLAISGLGIILLFPMISYLIQAELDRAEISRLRNSGVSGQSISQCCNLVCASVSGTHEETLELRPQRGKYRGQFSPVRSMEASCACGSE